MSFTASLEKIAAENRSGLLSQHATWERVKLIDVATILNGFPFPSSRFTKDRGIPLLRIRDVMADQTDAYFDGDVDPAYLVARGDLIIGMDGDFNCALWRGPQAALNQRTCKVTPHEDLYSRRFLAYVLPGYLSAVNAHTSSITVKHLSSKTVAELPLPLPPRSEQDRIVIELDRHLSRVNEAVQGLEHARKALSIYRASVLKAACEGRLVRESGTTCWNEVLPPLEESSGLGGRLKTLPKGWKWVRLGDLIEIGPQNGLYLPRTRYGNGQPILRIDDFQIGSSKSAESFRRVNATAEETSEFSLMQSDLVINRVNSPSHLGKCLVVEARHMPSIFESNMMRLRLAQSVVPHYLQFYLWSGPGRERLTRRAKWAVNQASINQTDVKETPVPLPAVDEQMRIVSEVERRLSIADEIATTVDAALARTARLRQSILKRAFEGKLVPQDPNDEPASVLLERIRKERESAAGESARKTQARTPRGRRAKARS